MRKKTVMLGLFADRIDVLSCAGDHVVRSRRIPVALGQDAGQWCKALESAGKSLRASVAELDIEGAATTVLYRNPTCSSDYASVKIRSASDAVQAGVLSLVEGLSCSLDQAATAGMVFGRDKTSTEAQTHLVVTADHDEVLDSIASFVELSGLKFAGATPLDAILMAKIGTKAISNATNTTAFLYVGEHRSFFLIADNGNLLFARPINIGMESLANSLTRPIRTARGESITITAEDAQRMLHAHGFPARETIVHDELQITGSQIIPLLQPVLQRFIVELRQSLRFGVAEEQRPHVSLIVTGPGSSIPNFVSLISGELNVKTTADEEHAAFDSSQPDSCGCEMMDALPCHKAMATLALKPQRLALASQANLLRRCMWTGAAVALLMVGMDFMSYSQRLTNAKRELSTIESQLGDASLRATNEKLLSMVTAMETLDATISLEVGAPVDLLAAMREISRTTPESVRLTLFTMNLEKNRTAGRLAGFAFDHASGTSEHRPRLEHYIEQLQRSPLFSEVVLSNVRTSSAMDKSGQQFEVSFTAVGVPLSLPGDAVAVADGGSHP